jgi:hypothetical protein
MRKQVEEQIKQLEEMDVTSASDNMKFYFPQLIIYMCFQG